MKKKLFSIMAAAVMTMSLVACGPTSEPTQAPTESPTSTITVRYTVKFEVDGERYKTCMVKEGEKITEAVPNPSKEGFKFEGWYEGSTLIDLSTYIVTKDVTFTAKFSEISSEDVLSVDDVKEEGKDYYMVFGWWEVNDPEDPEKITSGLTKDSVRLFYENAITFLKLKGATDADIENIQFRNYSTAKVAEMGEKINADGDVDIMIGVGANIFTTAATTPYNTSEDSKFQTEMGTAGKSRYVALMSGASELAKEMYDWLGSTVGCSSFLKSLTEEEIEASLGGDVINLAVTVHGDTDITTTLTDKETVIEMPTITVEEGEIFLGFSTVADGDIALDVAIDAELRWDDVKDLAAGAATLDLYPVIEMQAVSTANLVVYIQVNGSHLTAPEAMLLAQRFNSTLTEDIYVDYRVVEGGADDFTAALGTDADVIIGGNNPLKNYGTHADGPLANSGAYHFASTSRKIIISDTVADANLELAKTLYNFVIADAPTFEVHSTFWTKEYTWVTADEVATIKTGMETTVNTLFGLTEGTAAETYNITYTYYEATNTKVADLGAETLALRDGKGTDLIIGCGKNVTSTGLVEVADKKVVSLDIIAAERYVAIVNSNVITQAMYDMYFTEYVPA